VPDYISPYILLSEYTCGCGCGLPPSFDEGIPDVYEEFFDDFSIIRGAWGKPIKISSGYRCPKYNKSIGGSPISVHMFGMALDLDVSPTKVEGLDEIIEGVAPHLRRGKYTVLGSFIHIDVGFEISPRISRSWVEGYRFYG